MRFKLKTYSIWEFGKRVDAEGKPHQEDDMFPAHGSATDSDRLFILCDGMGGHEAGEVASATVCDAISRHILSAAPDPEGAFPDELFLSALDAAFVALDAKDTGTAVRKMGTTLTLLKFHSAGCLIAHMGDSRVYHIRPGRTVAETRILFRTEDHSLVNDLVKIGELTPEEARHSRQRNVITRALQPHMEYRPKADIYRTADIQPGDYFYLCTDGMLENMDDGQLRYFFSAQAGDDRHKVLSLQRATRENSDNHSAIIVHVVKVATAMGGEPAPAGPLKAFFRRIMPKSGKR
ncbi:MAG: protein phosphatase 2C domain-containing protein [Prevotellaceae bacterium]|nr:protein phosphatase 2C domain-containing protein [Prevotellaceae bacterium]